MKTWTITINGKRSTVPVSGSITLRIEAETFDEANALALDSLPGFDWKGWISTRGIERYVESRRETS